MKLLTYHKLKLIHNSYDLFAIISLGGMGGLCDVAGLCFYRNHRKDNLDKKDKMAIIFSVLVFLFAVVISTQFYVSFLTGLIFLILFKYQIYWDDINTPSIQNL